MMTHPDRAEPQRMTIETLLQLKRAERPAPEFWEQFEQELRAKQLAAIIEKRPWWMALRLPALSPALRRLPLPVGAAAALAVAFFVASERGLLPGKSSPDSRPTEIVSTGSRANAEVLLEPMPILATVTPVAAGISAKNDPEVSAAMVSSEVDTRVEVAEAPASLVAEKRVRVSEPAGLMEMIPWAAAFRVESNQNAPRTPADYAELPHVYFAAAVLPGQEFDFDGRVDLEPMMLTRRVAVSAKPVVAQPAPVLSSREVRRNRILSNLNVADAGAEGERAKVVQGREMLVSSLDDSGLYDSVRRLGMGGDRLTLKF